MERTHQLLSAAQLIAAAGSIGEIESKILNHGLKPKFPLGTPEEAAIIKSYQDDLRRLISLERIARGSDRSTAHIENGSVKIVRRVGKWNLFGSGNHLQWHEALYLMEMNRLEVYFDSMVVSLERAYSLFLRKSTDASDCGKLSRAEYAVYSHFMREGYIVQAHSPESQGESSRISTKSDKSNQTNPDTQTQQCIWKYLFELLGQQQHAMQRADVDSETYERVKRSMDNTISKFKPQDVLRDSVPRKRKHDDGETSSGGLHHSNHDFGSGRLNAFMIGDERTTFKRVFDEIDIIHLNANDSTENDPSNGTLNFSFDLWTDGVFKKTEIPDPHYRIAVLRSDRKELPNIQHIKNLFQRQVHKCPIILIYVSDELAFHAYIYRFTT